ncbi:MAG: hypothetical protein ED859_02025 [Desulfuromonadales bacterium]|nr:MAG: hypothetical protein ED859_02025 [Desulfuromonadales bacterium]
MSIRHLSICAALLLAIQAVSLLGPRPLHARVSGEVDLGYVQYDAEANGQKVTSANSFHHRYSLLYSTAGSLYGGRVGSYDVTVGYEWGSFNTKIRNPNDSSADQNPSISAGHVLYRGELVVDPLELPLKMRLYSYDMNRVSMLEDTVPISSSTMIRPGLITNLIDGTHIATGATLLFGVKNGLTNGYNAIFRHIPLVMVDYRDEYNKDTKSSSPVDTRMRRLAFVSLNKRDNWFHYRTTRFEDNLSPFQSFTESQIQIGTVDHTLNRRWIDLTNWLKISTDMQFTKHSSATAANTFEAYDLNFFAIATRQAWDARTFSTFSRVLDQQGLSLERTVPVYASGVWGADGNWNGMLSSRERRVRRVDGSENLTSNVNGSLRSDLFSRSSFTLGTSVKAEHTDTDGVKLLSLEGGVETASTRRFSRDYSLGAGYTIKYFDSSNGSRGSSSYLNQNLYGRVIHSPSTSLRLELNEQISAGSGSNPQNFSNSSVIVNSDFNNSSAGGSTVASNFQRRDNTVNEYLRSVTTAGAYWSPVPRVTVSFTVSEDVLARPDLPTDYLTSVRNTIDYSTPTFLARIRSSYNYRVEGGASIGFLESQGAVEYRPNRNLESSLVFTYSKGDIAKGLTSEYIDLRQRLGYTFYTFSGVSRKLLELTQEFTYNTSVNAGDLGNIVDTTRRFSLGARYFPLKNLYLGAFGQYSFIDPGGVSELVYNGTIGLSFRKLQASLDYAYGKRNGSDNRIEKRIAANVKKFF